MFYVPLLPECDFCIYFRKLGKYGLCVCPDNRQYETQSGHQPNPCPSCVPDPDRDQSISKK